MSDEEPPDWGPRPPSSEFESEMRQRMTTVETNLEHLSDQQEEILEALDGISEGRSIEEVKDEHREMYFWYSVARYAVGLGMAVGTSGILAIEFVV